jgi:hypothetical protein
MTFSTNTKNSTFEKVEPNHLVGSRSWELGSTGYGMQELGSKLQELGSTGYGMQELGSKLQELGSKLQELGF